MKYSEFSLEMDRLSGQLGNFIMTIKSDDAYWSVEINILDKTFEAEHPYLEDAITIVIKKVRDSQ